MVVKNEHEKKKVYFNKMQREATIIGAKDTVIVAGRGTGKGLIHSAINLENFQAMPGSTTAFVAPNAKRALTNTLPSMFLHWENWGYKRDVHYVVGHKPPRALNWPKPLITPDNYDNIITFYTGAIGQIISQDRTGTSNSKSFDFVDIDEAKFVDFDQLKNETFQANRGQIREFGHYPRHHGMLITSDMSLTKKGSWFMNYENQCDQELIDVIGALLIEEFNVKQRMKEADAPSYLKKRLSSLQRQIAELRRHALFYKVYSTLTNMEVLGEEFIRQMKRDLPPLIFQTSILCIPVLAMRDGFYSSMTSKHVYNSTDFHYLDSLGYDFDRLSRPDSRMDGDLLRDQPLCVAFDFNRNINWMVVGQNDEELGRLNTVKSFWVKYERKLEALVDDFCDYYEYYPNKEVVFYYDNTALGGNYAVNDHDFAWVICHRFELRGWKVRPVYIGQAMNHADKHLLINRGFSGQNRLTPYFNEQNNEDLLVSIRTAGVYNGKKDKRGEKLAETEEDRLEARTDGSDAWDTLYVGCERFPQVSVILPISSNWS